MKKGFTLIELLAVISILAIIILLSVPNLLKAIKGNKEKTLDKTKSLIVAAAKNYVVDYDIDTPNVIGLDDLCGTYINCPIKNPVTEEDIDGCVKITISSKIENYTFIDNPSECTGGTNGEKLSLKVNLNGGVTTQTFNETYNRYSSLTLESPTKEGWVFIGWRVTKGNAEVNTNTLQFKATDVEIDALWGKNVELTLDLDGGSSSQVLNNPYVTNTNIELVGPTKTGYSFTGWELVSGDSIISGNNITLGLENTTIKATYGIGSYVCNAGEYLKKGETSCTLCPAGSYCKGGTYPYNPSEDQGISGVCAKESYSEAGASGCTACQNGKTTTETGQTSCNANCNNTSNVSVWNIATWTENSVEGSCSISKCVDGYVVNNNTCVEAVASNTINGATTYYLSLQEAIDASTTGESKLLKNTTENNVAISSSANKTLNLNGKTLTGYLKNYGTLTINGNGSIISSFDSAIANHGVMTITDGTFTRNTNGWCVTNYNILTFNGGTAIYEMNDAGAAIGNVGSSTILYINGGEIKSQGHGVAVRGKTYIRNATITSYNSYPAIASHESGYAEIENSTINGEIYNASGCSGDSQCSSSYPKNLTIIKGSTINGKITQHTNERTIRYYKDNDNQYSVHLFGAKITRCGAWTTANQSDIAWYNASKYSWPMGDFYACFITRSNHTTDSYTTHFYNNNTYVDGFIWAWQ